MGDETLHLKVREFSHSFLREAKGLRRIKGGCIEHSALVRGIDGEEILRVEDIIAAALPKAWAV